MHVRDAHPVEFAELVLYGRDWWKLTEFAGTISYDPYSVVSTLRSCRENHMLAVAEDDHEIVGFVGGVVVPAYMNMSHNIGTELFWWVRPDARGKGVGAALLSAIEDRARRAGCTYWTMIAMQCMDPERAGAIYERAGYRWTERSYTKKL